MKIRRLYKLLFFLAAAVWSAFVIAGIAETEKSANAESMQPPIGTPRSDKDYSKDVNALLFDRRTSSSDMPGGISFNPKECMRCHENEPGVEGQIFYGNSDYKKDLVWPKYIGDAETKKAPSLKYNFADTHKKKAELVREYKEQILKQNQ